LAIERAHRAFWLSTAVLVAGVASFLYAQALAAFIALECPRFTFDAPGECGWAYRLDVAGIVLALAGALGDVVLLVRAFRRRRS